MGTEQAVQQIDAANKNYLAGHITRLEWRDTLQRALAEERTTHGT